MTWVWIVNVLLTLIVIASAQECGLNEVLEECPHDCASDYCPKHRLSDSTPCTKPLNCPPPSCKCRFNYRRADNNTCIPTTECPPFDCPENEVFDPCPSYCPTDDCKDAELRGTCPYLILIVVNCSPACKCIEHFYRNDGICVPYKDCPMQN